VGPEPHGAIGRRAVWTAARRDTVSRERRTKDGEELRTSAMSEAFRDVDEIQTQTVAALRRDLFLRSHSKELERLQRARARGAAQSLYRDFAILKRKHADRLLGGVRGKYHPSKKGLGKTVSTRAQRRERDHG
jgi:hypothetical protein